MMIQVPEDDDTGSPEKVKFPFKKRKQVKGPPKKRETPTICRTTDEKMMRNLTTVKTRRIQLHHLQAKMGSWKRRRRHGKFRSARRTLDVEQV